MRRDGSTWPRSILMGGLAASIALFVVSPAQAVDSVTRAAARDLGYEGVQAFQASDFEEAVSKLERAYAALPVPSLALWSARALEKNGKLVEAAERYLEATRAEVGQGGDQKVQLKAQESARTERESLLPRIPKLTIHIQGADAAEVQVLVAGVEIPSALLGSALPTNPGTITIEGKVDERSATENAELVEGASMEITLAFAATAPPLAAAPVVAAVATPPPPSEAQPKEPPASDSPPDQGSSSNWQPVAGWIGIGTGAAFVAGGSIFGIMAGSQYKDLGCASSGLCPPGTSQGDIDAANMMRTLSTVGFIAGGVLVAGGLTLLLTAPSAKRTAYVSPYLGVASAGFKGAF